MYADLKAFGRLSYRETADLLLGHSATPTAMALAARVHDRTFLSREIVHAAPGGLASKGYGNIAQRALDLMPRLIDARLAAGARDETAARAEILERYLGPSANAMAAALDANGLPGTLYLNARDNLHHVRLIHESDRPPLPLMLFIAAGCLGDPASAVRTVETYLTGKLSTDLHTTETNLGAGTTRPDPTSNGGSRRLPVIGLLRIVDGLAKEPLHRLSCDPEGTVIGAMPTSGNRISDVDRDVSRNHLRIWRDPSSGSWLAQGLGSTNGTIVISGEDRSARVVEPPRRDRRQGAAYPPIPLLNSDMIRLGATTFFLVVQMVD